MNVKRKNQIFITLLVISLAVAIFGVVFLIFACHGECGSDVHGGMWTWVCPRFYFPKVGSIIMIAVGAIGAITMGSFWALATRQKRRTAHEN